MSQKERILHYLEKNDTINKIEAMNKFGCWRLAARIHELRKEGNEIETEITSPREGVQYATYTLES